jgi:hypothetical protein
VFTGLLAGIVRARIRNRSYHIPQIRHTWLVLGAFIPQWLAFYFPPTLNIIPDWLAPILLTGSLLFLLAFSLLNINHPGFLVLGLGLVMNLLVIFSNGGLMPITPLNAAHISTNHKPDAYQARGRFGYSKDIVIPKDDTRLWEFSDRLVSPKMVAIPVCFQHWRYFYRHRSILDALAQWRGSACQSLSLMYEFETQILLR